MFILCLPVHCIRSRVDVRGAFRHSFGPHSQCLHSPGGACTQGHRTRSSQPFKRSNLHNLRPFWNLGGYSSSWVPPASVPWLKKHASPLSHSPIGQNVHCFWLLYPWLKLHVSPFSHFSPFCRNLHSPGFLYFSSFW
jgi:hypothetical protein